MNHRCCLKTSNRHKCNNTDAHAQTQTKELCTWKVQQHKWQVNTIYRHATFGEITQKSKIKPTKIAKQLFSRWWHVWVSWNKCKGIFFYMIFYNPLWQWFSHRWWSKTAEDYVRFHSCLPKKKKSWGCLGHTDSWTLGSWRLGNRCSLSNLDSGWGCRWWSHYLATKETMDPICLVSAVQTGGGGAAGGDLWVSGECFLGII